MPLGKKLSQQLRAMGHTSLADEIHNLLKKRPIHGQESLWSQYLKDLPGVSVSHLKLQDTIEIGQQNNLSANQHILLKQALEALRPWRKGPYCLFGIAIDTEWRSDLKWQRIAPHVQLSGKSILDIGCANGYFGWRMLQQGASHVLGIDPSPLYIRQFELINHFIQSQDHLLLPLTYEEVVNFLEVDMVFSLGVIYHRRDPHEHLRNIHANLRPAGELVIESLVVDDEYAEFLLPKDRYAQMRNVWTIPSVSLLGQWIKDAGFGQVRLLDVTTTSTREQRKTSWIQSHSLEDFLDQEDPSLTVEGYPRPKRAIYIARKESR